MGGRGSSGIGGGGLNRNDIKNTWNLHIDPSLDDKTRGEIMSTLKEFKSEYGIDINNTRGAELKKSSRAIAFYDREGIAVNKRFLDSEALTKTMQDCANSGFHPPIGNKTGMEAVMAHEIGHQLNDMIASKTIYNMEGASRQIVEEAQKALGYKGGYRKFAENISNYAKKNTKETIAEAVADVYCNGNNAKAESRAIVDVVNKYLKGK